MAGIRKGIAALICATVVTVCAGIAMADQGGWCGEHSGKHRQHDFSKIAKKLGLTEAQKAQQKTIFKENKEAMKPVIAKLKTEQKNLRSLLHGDTIDEAAIRSETAKVSEIQADLKVLKAEAIAQFRAILTPTQLASLKTLHQKHQKKDDTTD